MVMNWNGGNRDGIGDGNVGDESLWCNCWERCWRGRKRKTPMRQREGLIVVLSG